LIKVLVVDEEALLRSAFCSLIEAQDDLEVVGVAADGRQAAELRRDTPSPRSVRRTARLSAGPAGTAAGPALAVPAARRHGYPASSQD
jgi:hypothetical protein